MHMDDDLAKMADRDLALNIQRQRNAKLADPYLPKAPYQAPKQNTPDFGNDNTRKKGGSGILWLGLLAVFLYPAFKDSDAPSDKKTPRAPAPVPAEQPAPRRPEVTLNTPKPIAPATPQYQAPATARAAIAPAHPVAMLQTTFNCTNTATGPKLSHETTFPDGRKQIDYSAHQPATGRYVNLTELGKQSRDCNDAKIKLINMGMIGPR